jgi:hypothetical protein
MRRMKRTPILLSVIVVGSLVSNAYAVWPVDGVPASRTPGAQSRPVSVADGSGGAIIALAARAKRGFYFRSTIFFVAVRFGDESR